MQLLAVGAQFVIAVEHQHVLDDQAVGLAGVNILAHIAGPGGGPVHDPQVLIGSVYQLAPAGLVQTKDQIAVLVLVGGLNGGSVAGNDSLIVNGDVEASVFGLGNEPGGALGGVGVGIDADGVAVVGFHAVPAGRGGVVRGGGRLAGIGGRTGVNGRVVVLLSAGGQGQDHDQGKQECKRLFHRFVSFSS